MQINLAVKSTLLTLLLLCLVAASHCFAITVGEEDEPERTVSLSGDVTLLRNRDVKGIDTARVKSDQYSVTVGYRPVEKIELFGKVASANLELHRFEGETHFFSERVGYGLGASYEIREAPVRVEFACQYFSFEPGGGKVTGVSEIPRYKVPHEVTADWTELQVSLKVAKKLESFTVYGGPKYSTLECDQKRTWPTGETEDETFKSQDNFGAFAGISLDFSDKTSGFFETRFIDETAYTIGISYQF